MAAVMLVVEHEHRQAILEQTRLRALSLGTSLAALSEAYLVSYNYVQLEQAAEKLIADDEDVIYTIAHLCDGKVAAYSEHSDLQGKRLADLVSQRALQAERPLIQETILPQTREPGYDVAIPACAPGSAKKWGTIRVGFSLQRAYAHIQYTRRTLLVLSLIAVVCGTLLAIYLATQISKPVGQLGVGVHQVAEGAYDCVIYVDANDEIGYLAQAFEQMGTSLQRHLAHLAGETQQLEEANQCLQDTQQQLLQSERLAAVGKLAARVAHEVNNPLAIIKTAMCIMRTQSHEDNLSNGHLQMVEEEINRIARIL